MIDGSVKVYFVRQSAYESLKRMGVALPKPVLEMPVVRQ
jgi:hypothetical protein